MNMRVATSSPHMRAATRHDWLARLTQAAELGITWLRRRRQVRRNAEMLTALDDRLLADIGITRDQVRYVAHLGRLPGRD